MANQLVKATQGILQGIIETVLLVRKTCFELLKSLILTTFVGYKSKVVKVVNFNDYAFSGI